MNKRILTLLFVLTVSCTLAACGAPVMVGRSDIGLCKSPRSSLGGLPYTKTTEASCAVALRPFDLSVWIESPYNSHKTRGLSRVTLGCKLLTPDTDNCNYAGVPGHSNTLMLNFDLSAYPDDASVQKAVLAVYAPGEAEALAQVLQVRGRLNIGDELQSVGRNPQVPKVRSKGGGWIILDISRFAARAIAERRNSVSFELSLACQRPDPVLAEISLSSNEPRVMVEFK